MQARTRRRLITIAPLILVLAALAGTAWYYFAQYDSISRQNVEAFVRGFGAWAPVAYAALYIISALIPLLAPLLSAVGGLLFGAVRGTLYIIVIATASALVPFSLARRLGRDFVASKLKGKRLEEIYEQSGGSKGFTFIVLMRLIPVLPWEVQNYVAGLTKVGVPTFLLATMVGTIPGSFSLAFLGTAATDPGSWQFFVAVAFKVVTALVPVVALAVRSRRGKRSPDPTGGSA